MSSDRGNLIVVSAASGSGKSTMVDLALARLREHAPAERAITCTTRPPRGQERDGVDYYFLSTEEFERRIAAGDFLEYARVHGERLYGTSRTVVEEALSRGVDLILVIDVQGAESIRKAMPEAVTVFIMPPSLQVLEERLRERNRIENHNDEADLAARLASARTEIRRFEEFDYVIVNDDLEEALRVFASIVTAERSRAHTQKRRLHHILKTFGETFHA